MRSTEQGPKPRKPTVEFTAAAATGHSRSFRYSGLGFQVFGAGFKCYGPILWMTHAATHTRPLLVGMALLQPLTGCSDAGEAKACNLTSEATHTHTQQKPCRQKNCKASPSLRYNNANPPQTIYTTLEALCKAIRPHQTIVKGPCASRKTNPQTLQTLPAHH